MKEVLGTIHGCRIKPRTKEEHGTDSPLIQLLVEDDEYWYETDRIFDAYWIDDLISVLQKTKQVLKEGKNS